MLRSNATIPDPLACQCVSTEGRRYVDDDVTSEFVSTNMRYQTHSRCRYVSLDVRVNYLSFCWRRIVYKWYVLPLKFLLEFIAEHGTKFPAAIIATTMPADQNQYLIDFPRSRELPLHLWLSLEHVLLLSRQAIVALM